MMGVYAGLALVVILGGLIVWAFVAGRKGGIEAAEGHLAKDEAEAEERAADAQVNAPRSAEAIDARLRKGGGL